MQGKNRPGPYNTQHPYPAYQQHHHGKGEPPHHGAFMNHHGKGEQQAFLHGGSTFFPQGNFPPGSKGGGKTIHQGNYNGTTFQNDLLHGGNHHAPPGNHFGGKHHGHAPPGNHQMPPGGGRHFPGDINNFGKHGTSGPSFPSSSQVPRIGPYGAELPLSMQGKNNMQNGGKGFTGQPPPQHQPGGTVAFPFGGKEGMNQHDNFRPAGTKGSLPAAPFAMMQQAMTQSNNQLIGIIHQHDQMIQQVMGSNNPMMQQAMTQSNAQLIAMVHQHDQMMQQMMGSNDQMAQPMVGPNDQMIMQPMVVGNPMQGQQQFQGQVPAGQQQQDRMAQTGRKTSSSRNKDVTKQSQIQGQHVHPAAMMSSQNQGQHLHPAAGRGPPAEMLGKGTKASSGASSSLSATRKGPPVRNSKGSRGASSSTASAAPAAKPGASGNKRVAKNRDS